MFRGDVAGSSNFVAKLAPTTSNRIHSRVGAVGDFGRRSFGRGSQSSGRRNFGKGSAMLAVLGFCLSHRHSWRRQCVLEDAPLEKEGSLHEMAGAEWRCHPPTHSRQRHDRRPGHQSFGGIEVGGAEESHGHDR